MDTKIQDLNIPPPTVKSALLSKGFIKASDLAGHNYITLAKIFPKNCIVEPIINELNPLGYLLPPENEIFDEYQFPAKIYPLFFKNGISCINDFNHKTSYDIYTICEQNYPIIMKTYFIFKKNGITLDDWHDKFLFEIHPMRKADLLWKKHKLNTVSQFSVLTEQQLKEIISDIPALSKILDKSLCKS